VTTLTTVGDMMKAIILTCVLLMVMVGCGRKAPPVPWESIVPKRIVDLQGMVREGRLLLEWTAPKENTDKSVVTDLVSFQVLRAEGNLVSGECKGCVGLPKVVFEMKLEKAEEVQGKKVSISFDDLEPGKGYVYTIISVNHRNDPRAPSNPVQIYWELPPPAPTVVKGEPGDKKVELTWEAVGEATGYSIYRRQEGEVLPSNPLNREPLKETQYIDLNVVNDKTYLYSIRSVRRVVKTDIEGIGSVEVPETPIDLIPPSSPVGFEAVPTKEGIELNWRKNQESDLLGYYVYRRKTGEKEFQRLTPNPITKETYVDKDVELEQDYEYAVTAVDNSPRRNESPPSEEARVTYHY
jgi:hypothetical protein